MTKVLIVDDELLVRVGIKSSLDWGKYNFEIVGEAANGEEALKILRARRIDIVLLDIDMPVLNGINVLEAMKAENIESKVIILSCHEDFKYAQQALRLGAVDYVLKLSINSEKLCELLLNVQQLVRSTPDSMRGQPLQEQWNKIACGETVFELDALKKCGSRLKDEKVMILLVAAEKAVTKKPASPDSDNRLFHQSIKNFLSDIINDYGSGDVFLYSGLFVAVFNYAHAIHTNLNVLLEDLGRAMKRYMQLH